MATRVLLRTLVFSANQTLIPRFSTYLVRLRPLVANLRQFSVAPTNVGAFWTRSSLNGSKPNRRRNETIRLEGLDLEHWLVLVDDPKAYLTRDEIIDSYIKILAEVVGSYDEARMKIYSVSTTCYYAFGALVSKEVAYKIKKLPEVRWVVVDSYLDVMNKDYGGEPFIDGKAVPYDSKYHKDWSCFNVRHIERTNLNLQIAIHEKRWGENLNLSQGPPPNMGGVPPSNMGGGQQGGGGMGGGPPSNMGGIRHGGGGMGGGPPSNMGGRRQGGGGMGGPTAF